MEEIRKFERNHEILLKKEILHQNIVIAMSLLEENRYYFEIDLGDSLIVEANDDHVVLQKNGIRSIMDTSSSRVVRDEDTRTYKILQEISFDKQATIDQIVRLTDEYSNKGYFYYNILTGKIASKDDSLSNNHGPLVWSEKLERNDSLHK